MQQHAIHYKEILTVCKYLVYMVVQATRYYAYKAAIAVVYMP